MSQAINQNQEVRFDYYKDPFFLACVAVYLINRFWLRGVFPHSFWTEHLNDLLCIGFWVPPMAWGLQRFKLRASDGPPTAAEVAIPLIVWSVVFEIILPGLPFFERRVTADYRDIFYYSLGALLATFFWRIWYRPSQKISLP